MVCMVKTVRSASGGWIQGYSVLPMAYVGKPQENQCVSKRQNSTRTESRRMISLTRRGEVFDQENFVSFFVVDQLVHEVHGQQEPIPAGAQALGLTEKSVTNGVIG